MSDASAMGVADSARGELYRSQIAVDELELAPADDAMLWDYLERAAHAMVNTFEE